MQEHSPTLDKDLAILRRRKWQTIVPTASILFAIAVLVALLVPPTYRSTATLLIERLEIPPDPARAKAMSQVDQRLQLIGRRVMTTGHLGALIERYDLYPDIRRRDNLDMAVAEMRKHIKLDALGVAVPDIRTGRAHETAVTCLLSFEDRSARVAQAVVQELVSLFLSESLKHRTTANQAANSLHIAAERLAAEIDMLKTRLATVERQRVDQHTISELRRDYENAMAKYREIREQSLQAELVQSLEHDRQGERFSLLKPPGAPEKPDTPNRLAILVLGFVLAGAGGVGHLILLERLDTRLYGPEAIQSAAPIPLLAVVPYIESTRDRQTRLKRTYTRVGVALTLALAATVVLHWLVMPLDLLWSSLMRRVDVAASGWLG